MRSRPRSKRSPIVSAPCFTLCHVAEQSTAEVSQALGVSEATVRVHLFRARRRLRRLLERHP
jgi:DNA-directed RNA polymerase specialized sigma24 family protein